MALPPNDMEPSELFAKLMETPAPSEVIDFPRKNADGQSAGRVRIMVLAHDRHQEAQIKVHRHFKEKKYTADEMRTTTLEEVIGDAVAKELIALACFSENIIPGTDHSPRYARIFRNGDDVGKITADEIKVLFNAYMMVQYKYSPYAGAVDGDDHLNAWIKRLAEGGSAFPLAQCSWHQLIELVMLLASRGHTLSRILESQLPNLQDISKYPLENWAIGTSYFGTPDEESTTTGSETELPPTMDPAVPLTVADAAKIAEQMHKGNYEP